MKYDNRHMLRNGLAAALLAGAALGMIGLSFSGFPSPRLPAAAQPVDNISAARSGLNAEITTVTLKEADVSTAARLDQTFSRLGYDLDLVAAGYISVPRIVIETLPEDLDHLESADQRKSLFVRALLPTILQVNEEIGATRISLLSIQNRMNAGETLRGDDVQLMTTLAASLDIPGHEVTPAALLRQYDIIPPSLALAQAIEESGWGTSRIAQDKNALFGQFGPSSRGRRSYREYASLIEGVRSYAHNLNTHPAYARFRELRAQLRQKTQPGLNGPALAGTLEDYCNRGQDYVQTLRTIIRANGLASLDHARLSTQGPAASVAMF